MKRRQTKARTVDRIGSPLPLAGGLDDDLDKERASATPTQVSGRHHRVRRSATVGKTIAGPLRHLQSWFQTVITDPGNVEAGIRRACRGRPPDRWIRGDTDFSSEERLGIYHYAYHARLIECLADDFAMVKVALGETAFERLARAYIAAKPSRSPNLNGYGAKFPAFVARGNSPVRRRPFITELARLEWALVETIHAAEPKPLDAARLGTLQPGQWGRLRLIPSPTLRVFTFRHPVNTYFEAVRRGGTPVLPRPAWSATAVYRTNYQLWRMDLSKPMYRLLTLLCDGQPLGLALARVSRATEAPQVMRWFQEWVAGGFFTGFRLR